MTSGAAVDATARSDASAPEQPLDRGAPATPAIAVRSTIGVLLDASREWARLPGLTATALGALVVQQLFFTGFALSLKAIIDDVTEHRPGSDLATVLALLLAGFIVAALATVVGERAAAKAGAQIVNGIRRGLYGHLLHLSPTFFLTAEPGEVESRFGGNLMWLEGGYIRGYLDTAVLVLSAAITVPLLFLLDWRLAVITCVMLPIVIVLVDRLLPRSADANEAVSASERSVLTTVQDTIRAQQVVRAFSLEGLLTRRFDRLLGVQQQRSVHARRLAAVVAKGANLGALLVQVVVIVVGAELASHQVITIGGLVAFVTVLGLVARNVCDFARTDLPLLADAARGARGVAELRAVPVVVSDPEHGSELPPVRGAIAFDRVSFAYTPGHPVLADVSFAIAPGTTTVLVGANGSGKTTLLSLLLRFHDPETGSVSVDGCDLREVTQPSFRSQLSAVLQRNYIFNDTIGENIRIGNPEASDEEIVAAARRAELHDFISSLPDGYDTQVGDSGARLSGGQSQRLAIARALIRNPRVLVLDEVTTALDPATEAAVNAMLARAGQGCTMISVTHRLAAARDADQILVLDRGRLVEHGTHDELMTERGAYRALWEKQSGFEVSGDGRRASVDSGRLRHITLFSDLDDGTLGRIAAGLESEYYEPDQVVFARGDVGDGLYLIARGKVQVIAPGVDGAEHVLEALSDGDHFGELALLQDRPRTATIRTVTPCVFLTMGREEFLRLVASTPGMTRRLEERMTRSELNLEEWRRLVGRSSE